ncbi:hypothetical protein, partial [Sphingobium bisphenolivorans]|uniref:hypothetical protein n=1 Tax=Sphingobium bisphenolivorans TaxID=1335760 RepID=UPI00187BFB90
MLTIESSHGFLRGLILTIFSWLRASELTIETTGKPPKMSSKKSSASTPLLRSSEAFEWNVAVPFDPTCYGAKAIQSMVKLANRRGEIRWFEVDKDGFETRWRLHAEPIKGVDFLEDFLSDLLEDKPHDERDYFGSLVVSFSEQSEARAFSRDLELLLALTKTTKGKRYSATIWVR